MFMLFEPNPAQYCFTKLISFMMNYKRKSEHTNNDGLDDGIVLNPFFELSFALVDIDIFKLYIVEEDE